MSGYPGIFICIRKFVDEYMKFILGLKLGMAQIFDEKGNVVPVTLIEAGPCIVTQVKTKDYYPPTTLLPKHEHPKKEIKFIQIGFKKIEKKKKIKKTMKGKEFRYLKEFRDGEYKIGDKIDASIFKEGDLVKVSGLSKGKGFAGVVKRWHFSGRPATHGIKHELRTPGSVGSSFPERVIKGRKMPGRMGFERVTIRNLRVVKVDTENNLIAVKGAVPGPKGTLLEIRA